MSKSIQTQEYIVEAILDKRINSRGLPEYLIKWEDYPEEDSTWEPAENVQAVKSLMDLFEKNLAKKEKEQKEKEVVNIIWEILQESVPARIVSVKLRNDEICCFCEFEQESNGITKDPCYIPSKFLKEFFPQILIDYYESKIWFVNRKINNKVE